MSFNYPDVAEVNRVATERGYKNRDEITISPKTMGDVYESKVKMFFNEHLHEDEEIRYILDGGGYFDVRDKDDAWVRIKLDKYDLMIMPAGIYHRFTTDTNNVSIRRRTTLSKAHLTIQQQYTKAMRLFQDDPKWTPLNRGTDTDENEIRKSYLKTRDGAPVAAH